MDIKPVAWADEADIAYLRISGESCVDLYTNRIGDAYSPLYPKSAIDALTAEVEKYKELLAFANEGVAEELARAEAEAARLRKLCLEAAGRVSVTPDGGDLHDRLIAAAMEGEG